MCAYVRSVFLRYSCILLSRVFSFFFFNDTATTEIYTLSLHDALPIFSGDNRPATGCSSILIDPLHPLSAVSARDPRPNRVGSPVRTSYQAPQHLFHFLPLPQGQGSLRPILGVGD